MSQSQSPITRMRATLKSKSGRQKELMCLHCELEGIVCIESAADAFMKGQASSHITKYAPKIIKDKTWRRGTNFDFRSYGD
jgi:hypothetical protein